MVDREKRVMAFALVVIAIAGVLSYFDMNEVTGQQQRVIVGPPVAIQTQPIPQTEQSACDPLIKLPYKGHYVSINNDDFVLGGGERGSTWSWDVTHINLQNGEYDMTDPVTTILQGYTVPTSPNPHVYHEPIVHDNGLLFYEEYPNAPATTPNAVQGLMRYCPLTNIQNCANNLFTLETIRNGPPGGGPLFLNEWIEKVQDLDNHGNTMTWYVIHSSTVGGGLHGEVRGCTFDPGNVPIASCLAGQNSLLYSTTTVTRPLNTIAHAVSWLGMANHDTHLYFVSYDSGFGRYGTGNNYDILKLDLMTGTTSVVDTLTYPPTTNPRWYRKFVRSFWTKFFDSDRLNYDTTGNPINSDSYVFNPEPIYAYDETTGAKTRITPPQAAYPAGHRLTNDYYAFTNTLYPVTLPRSGIETGQGVGVFDFAKNQLTEDLFRLPNTGEGIIDIATNGRTFAVVTDANIYVTNCRL